MRPVTLTHRRCGCVHCSARYAENLKRLDELEAWLDGRGPRPRRATP